MKNLLIFMLAIVLGTSLLNGEAYAAEPNAKAFIVYEPNSGTVLMEENADTQMLIASTTKIMTAMLTIERCDMDEQILVSDTHLSVEGSTAHLRAGKVYTVYELLCGLMLASGNDAALVLAEHVGGNVDHFVQLMNAKCRELGLMNTHFANPHGLDDPAHYSTARDLAILTASAMESEVFSEIFSLESCCIHGITYQNHNKLLSELEGCIGGKTGYTKAAGRVLVSCAERDGMCLICVTISDPDDWKDHTELYEECFADWKFYSLPNEKWCSLPLLSGYTETVELACGVAGVVLPADAKIDIKVELPLFVFAPLECKEILGCTTVYSDGIAVLSTEIYTKSAYEQDECIPLTVREWLHRGWDNYCRYGLNTVYPLMY